MSMIEPTPFRITVCGLDELAGRPRVGVTHVAVDPRSGLARARTLRGFDVHRRLKLHFHDVIEPLPGWIAPERWDVELLLAFARNLDEMARVDRAEPRDTHLAGALPCRAVALDRGGDPDPGPARSRPAGARCRDARSIRLRPRAWPNLRMLEIGDALLGRDGEIVAAVQALYRLALDREPGLAEAMIERRPRSRGGGCRSL